ncbi:hypothetical protein Tsubulata_007018 [Turnera subulata]|uniref:Cytochrome c assembly protein domain-containing protein n=1 Tax=Turnera subulata TaxID=218843 RepID=A0A9Q0FCY0_9ROSI|nr:hypothetical protein Tsubulata_007018 [Turnera subulata]
MSILFLQPYLFMSKTRSYAQILIGSRLFLTAMAIHLSLRVAPLDLQQGGNSRILYVHVPAARMSILVYITTAINTFFFLLTKHPLFLRSSGTGIEIGAFFTFFTSISEGFWGRPMWGTFWVWDARRVWSGKGSCSQGQCSISPSCLEFYERFAGQWLSSR